MLLAQASPEFVILHALYSEGGDFHCGPSLHFFTPPQGTWTEAEHSKAGNCGLAWLVTNLYPETLLQDILPHCESLNCGLFLIVLWFSL